jgi:hypothetical protein
MKRNICTPFEIKLARYPSIGCMSFCYTCCTWVNNNLLTCHFWLGATWATGRGVQVHKNESRAPPTGRRCSLLKGATVLAVWVSETRWDRHCAVGPAREESRSLAIPWSMTIQFPCMIDPHGKMLDVRLQMHTPSPSEWFSELVRLYLRVRSLREK